MVAILYGYSKVQEIDAVSTYLHSEIDGGITRVEKGEEIMEFRKSARPHTQYVINISVPILNMLSEFVPGIKYFMFEKVHSNFGDHRGKG